MRVITGWLAAVAVLLTASSEVPGIDAADPSSTEFFSGVTAGRP